MSELSDEIKKRILQDLRKSVRNTNVLSVHQAGIENSSISANVSSGGGTGGRFTLTIEGLKVSSDIMHKIFKRWRFRQTQYFEPGLVSKDSKYTTGQTLGQTINQKNKIPHENLTVEDNLFSIQIPDVARLGDIKARKKRARNNHWELPPELKQHKRKRGEKKVLPWMLIQRGERKGQPWKAKTYNEVAGYIEKRKQKSVFFSDLQKIKDIVLTELINAIKK